MTASAPTLSEQIADIRALVATQPQMAIVPAAFLLDEVSTLVIGEGRHPREGFTLTQMYDVQDLYFDAQHAWITTG